MAVYFESRIYRKQLPYLHKVRVRLLTDHPPQTPLVLTHHYVSHFLSLLLAFEYNCIAGVGAR